MTIFPLMLIRAAGLPLHWLDDLANLRPAEYMPDTAAATRVSEAFDAALAALDVSPLRTAVYNARRDFYQKQKMPSESFVKGLREQSVLPAVARLLEQLEGFGKYREAQTEHLFALKDAITANYDLLRQLAREETLRRPLLFASHDLLDRLPAFAEKPVDTFNKKDRQTALSLLQYLTRASVKTSPLSRFTTVEMKRIGACPEEEEALPFSMKPQVAPNVALLPALYDVLLREPAFYRTLKVSLNPCITRRTETAIFSKKEEDKALRSWLYFDGDHESFQQMQSNPVTDMVVHSLLEQGRKLPYLQLLTQLGGEVEGSHEQLERFVLELVDYGLLEWELPEKGLSPSWCGNLFHYLGSVPDPSPSIPEAAMLLQWLRTTARILPFQSVEDVRTAQCEALRLAQAFFEKNGGTMPLFPPEQIFYEDVADAIDGSLSESVISPLLHDLRECWRQRNKQAMPAFRSRILSFASNILQEEQSIDLLDFCASFFKSTTVEAEARGTTLVQAPEPCRIGALLQIFRDETGAYRAVVNGLFPGGGKLFSRWLHLFSADISESLREWVGNGKSAHAFPWQGWSNANFQPAVAQSSLLVPDGRVVAFAGGRPILLGDLSVCRESSGYIQLIDKETNEPVVMTDLGLEAPELRPPAMQLLWHLGVPYVSIEAVAPPRRWIEGGPHWRFSERQVFGSLILARKAWQIDPAMLEQWLAEKKSADFILRLRSEMLKLDIPSRFFVRSIQEKPQYFDLNCPLSILMLAKTFQNSATPLVLTEMLPLPEQCIIRKNGLRAAEFVFEMEV